MKGKYDMTNNNSNNQPAIITDDIGHPSVEVIEVTCAARGWIDQNEALESLNEWATEYSVPRLQPVGLGTALKRAMTELAKGPDRDLKTTGRKGTAVYSLIATDLDKVDREEGDGRAVGHSEVSARVKVDPDKDDDDVEKFQVKIDPWDHPAAPLIRDRFDYYCGLMSATYDIKVWLTRKVLGRLGEGAVRSTDVQGKYWLRATDENRTALFDLRSRLGKLNDTGKLRLFLQGHSRNSQNAVDMIADAIIEEQERVCGEVEKLLDLSDSGERPMGKRALASKAQEMANLLERLNGLSESTGVASLDFKTAIEDVQKRIAIAELALDRPD